MRFRKLRITWSVWWEVVAVLIWEFMRPWADGAMVSEPAGGVSSGPF